MDKFEKIIEVVKDFQKKSDETFKAYKTAETKARARFSPDAFQTEFVMGDWANWAGEHHADTIIAVNEMMAIYDEIESEFESWVASPVDSSVLETLHYVNDFDLKLTMQELQVLEKRIAGSYFGKKIFSAIAEKNGFVSENVRIEDFLNNLTAARSVTEMVIRAYAGRSEDGFPGRDLIEHAIVDGADLGERPIWQLAAATQFPTKDGNLETARKLWQSAKAPMLYHLSDREREGIEKAVNQLYDRWGELNKAGADKLLKEKPDLISRLDSDPDFELGQQLKQYYLLGDVRKTDGEKETDKEEFHSTLKASPVLGKRPGHSPSDMSILAEY